MASSLEGTREEVADIEVRVASETLQGLERRGTHGAGLFIAFEFIVKTSETTVKMFWEAVMRSQMAVQTEG